MSHDEQALLDAAVEALVWFRNRIHGNARNGQHDDILIARRLRAALDAYSPDELTPRQRECLDVPVTAVR